MEEIRINKYLSKIGFCSRREADKLISRGVVEINGTIAEMGTKTTENDVITVNGKEVKEITKDKVYIIVNKPIGIVCTTNSKIEKDNIVDFVNYPSRIYPVGRLDKRSEGLILMTNDGEIVNKIIHARNSHEKEYIVSVNLPVTEAFLEQMRAGVKILDTVTNPCKVEQIAHKKIKIILTQGLNRQIRRMCEALGYKVKKLKRIRLMNINLDVPIGKWRYLTDDELQELKSRI